MNEYRKCCKPFVGSKCSKKLRKVYGNFMNFLPPSIERNENLLICSSCYIKIYGERQKIETETSPISLPLCSAVTPKSSSTDVDSKISSIRSDSEEREIQNASFLQKINEILPDIRMSPIYASKLGARQQHQQQKLINLAAIVPSTSSSLIPGIEPLVNQSMDNAMKAILYDEFMEQLKSKFKQLEKKCDKIQLLTTLPKSLTIQQIQQEFNTTQYLVRKAKYIQETNGPLGLPVPKTGKRISDELKQSVIDYYNDDDVSRIMPGKNDCLTIEKVKVQKRLMLSTLKECYEGYKILHQDDESKKIGFSKFCLLRPKNCVQPGSSGTHRVCVCTIHQNVKLIIYGTKIEAITNGEISTYQDCISSILCPEPKPTCYLLKCKNCPGLNLFREYLKNAFLEKDYEDADLSFSQWTSTDRCNLKKYSKPLNVFLDYFIKKLENLVPHYFISLQQSIFIKNKKPTLGPTEALVSCDFAENYKFIMQNAAQGFHWNNKQATIHPFVIYINVDGKLQHYSFIVISDCLHHVTETVHLFIEKMIQFLKTKMTSLTKIYYITDGAAQHYKNKTNFMNISKHKEDFGVDCEWHFHATAHGKGPCDGVGGTIKGMASRASLTDEYDGIITNAAELFNWAKTLKTDMVFEFCSDNEYNSNKIRLASRFEKSKTIKGTRDFHAVIPSGEGYLNFKKYSNSEDYVRFKM